MSCKLYIAEGESPSKYFVEDSESDSDNDSDEENACSEGISRLAQLVMEKFGDESDEEDTCSKEEEGGLR